MRKEMLCVLGGLLAACGTQAQQEPAGFASLPYYQGAIQPVQMAPGAGYGGYGNYYYPNNYGYLPSYPANYGYGANFGYGAGYTSGTGVPSGTPVQVPSELPDSPAGATDAPVADQGTVVGGGQGAPNRTFWVAADYLAASVQRAPLRYPLVTTGSNSDPIPAALGMPNTAVVFGSNNLGTGVSSGVRGEAGMFLDSNHTFSLDVGGFVLFPQGIHSTTASDPNGFPAVGRPYINTVNGMLRAEQSAFNPFFAGSTSVDSTISQLFGFEANGRCNACLGTHWTGDLLAGFRLVRLQEDLTVTDRLGATAAGNNALTFLGQAIDPMGSLRDTDGFSTSNTFYGVNVGGRLRWQYDWFSVTAFGKVAVGATEETVRINGSTTLIAPAGNQTVVGGILAQPSNIGTYSRSVFGVVPEGGFTLGVQPIQHVRLTAGYSFLYWSAVARPGDQIDPRINRSAIPGDPTFGTGGAGPNPVFHFEDRSFRVHNLTAGVEIFY